MRRGPQIRPSVVHPIVIDMVNNHPFRRFEEHLVQVFALCFSCFNVSGKCVRMETFQSSSCIPFILSQPFVIRRVDPGVSRLRHRQPAKGIAVTQPPV